MEEMDSLLREIKSQCGIGFIADTDNGVQAMPKQYEDLLDRVFGIRRRRNSSHSHYTLSEECEPFYPVVLSNIKELPYRYIVDGKDGYVRYNAIMKNASGEAEIRTYGNFSLLFLQSHEGQCAPFAGIFSNKGKAYALKKVNKRITEQHKISIFGLDILEWDESKDVVMEEPKYLKMGDIVEKSPNPEESAYLTTVEFLVPSIEFIDSENEEKIKFGRGADSYLQFISGEGMREKILSVTPRALLKEVGTKIFGDYYTLALQIREKYIADITIL